MRTRIMQGLSTLRRTHEFLRAREYEVPMGELAPHIAQLGAVVAQLTALSVAHDVGMRRMRELTVQRRSLARELRREYMRPLAELGRTLMRDDHSHAKRYPIYRKKDDLGLAEAALSSAKQLQEDIARFVERGISPEFPARMRATAELFRNVITERGLEMGRRVKATKGLEVEMSLGYASLRILNTLLRPTFERSPHLLAEWDTVRRYRRQVTRGDEGDETTAELPPGVVSMVDGAPPRHDAVELDRAA
jgi:hypothetical protein